MSLKLEQLLNDTAWLNIVNHSNFESIAITIFKYQYENNKIYNEYVNALGKNISNINTISQIPFLPISFFKTHAVFCGNTIPDLFFESSGTTGMHYSRHYVTNPDLYRASFMCGFKEFYGKPEDYIFICLLPSYLERGNSSLVFMADELIKRSCHDMSGFYLNEYEKLGSLLQKKQDRKIILLGVTFALLDFAEAYPIHLNDNIVMETGGMKGRREEWTRDQVHDFLKMQWHVESIHSEYGMTELLSQAYSKGDGIFQSPSWMRSIVRDENDPFELRTQGSGGLNIIDLANIRSCSFIATDDIVKINDDRFEILGRLDNSSLRGCSLMVV